MWLTQTHHPQQETMCTMITSLDLHLAIDYCYLNDKNAIKIPKQETYAVLLCSKKLPIEFHVKQLNEHFSPTRHR